MRNKISLIILSILTISCSDFVKNVETAQYNEKVLNKNNASHFSVLFSHNINGETHPCGCRHFPLGGLAQVAGAMEQVKSKNPVIYVDTGDTFFPSSTIPKSMSKSLKFIADELAKSLEKLNLKYYLPGDQDFALGDEYLASLSKKAKFTFLISNLSSHSKIKHKKWVKVALPGGKNLYLFGVLSQQTMPSKYSAYITDDETAIKKTLAEIENEADSDDYIILLSHSGIDRDKLFAKEHPRINWIIGSHTQSFLRDPVEVGKTKIAQTLSRNHYLGHIQLPYAGSQATEQTKYEIIEIRDDWKDKIANNPFIKMLEEHKAKLKQIQEVEQNELAGIDIKGQRIPTARSCMECHSSQYDFWQSTAHSIAYQTLREVQEERNPSCIGCHSVGFQKKMGFSTYQHIILKDKKPIAKKDQKKYWNKISGFFKPHQGKSIRDMASKTRVKLAKKWETVDKKHKISHNFSNVQCLNCHDKSIQHPFENDAKSTSTMQSKCLNCHTTDQSPSWYKKDNKGLADKIDNKVYQQKLKSVACPK